jgi:hypothetical protein
MLKLTNRELGSYDPKRDKTYARTGREIRSGNQLAALIVQSSGA